MSKNTKRKPSQQDPYFEKENPSDPRGVPAGRLGKVRKTVHYFPTQNEQEPKVKIRTKEAVKEGKQRREQTQGTVAHAPPEVADQGQHFARRPDHYRRPDSEVARAAQHVLATDQTVDASQISIEVAEGVLTVDGIVPSKITRDYIHKQLECISGVREIKNRTVTEELHPDGEESFQSSSLKGVRAKIEKTEQSKT